MTLLTSALWALGSVLAITTAVWVLSLVAEDASLIDLFWGPLFAVQGWVYRGLAPDPGWAADLAAILVTVWALRLSIHLARRNLGKGEDPRYAAMREAGGPGWATRSLVTVFWLQAILAWIVAWPLALAARAGGEPGITSWIGFGVAAAGLAFETVADHQLGRFKADPRNRGRVMDRGLWRYSRHPNYFGDALFWWGIYGMAVGVGAAWTVFGPVVMTILLLKVSGVPLLETRMEETRPRYRDYARRTSAFVPWFPRGEG